MSRKSRQKWRLAKRPGEIKPGDKGQQARREARTDRAPEPARQSGGTLRGWQYLANTTLAAWPEDGTERPLHKYWIPWASVGPKGVVFDFEDRDAPTGTTRVELRNAGESVVAGFFDAFGGDRAHVRGRVYENKEGYLIFGTWNDESGVWTWITELRYSD